MNLYQLQVAVNKYLPKLENLPGFLRLEYRRINCDVDSETHEEITVGNTHGLVLKVSKNFDKSLADKYLWKNPYFVEVVQ